MPAAVGSLPEEAPCAQAGQVLDFGDGAFDLLAGPMECWAHNVELNGPALEPLTLEHLIAQVQGRTAPGPEGLLEHLQVLGEFGIGKMHFGIGWFSDDGEFDEGAERKLETFSMG